MSDQNQPTIQAFIDRGFPSGKIFCEKFLCSHEFSGVTLKSLVKRGKSQTKDELAKNVATALESQSISAHEVLIAFVQQPRKWLSFR